MRLTIISLLILLPCGPALAQSISLNWSADGTLAWYRADDGQLCIVDVGARTVAPAFDQHRLAEALAKETGSEVPPESFKVSRVAFGDADRSLHLRALGKAWLLDLRTYELDEQPFPAAEAAPLFLPPRRSGASAQSTGITVENKLAKPIQLFWIGRDGRRQHYGSIQPGEWSLQHTYVGHVWLVRTDRDLGCFLATSNGRFTIDTEALENVRREKSRGRQGSRRSVRSSRTSPDGKHRVESREHNLWLISDDAETQLTTNGTEENSYARRSGAVFWTPDSKHFVAFRTRARQERTVYMVESAPRDQVQPKLQSYQYNKPGDQLDTRTVHVFSTETGKGIPVSHELMPNPWSLRFSGWAESGDRFYLHYNQRGHQVLRLLEVSVADGTVRPVVEESSKTFIHYSTGGKAVFEDIDDDHFLWASERSGWNHLYRYACGERKLLNAVTSGDWNVKKIERIDRDAGVVWFYAVGVRDQQDPYHEHFCRVNFDGSNFRVLTEGDGTHQVRFEHNDRFLLDSYSRVDMAPVTELRDATTGELIAELNRQDTNARFRGRRLTERFVAKGRDGKTDIWGIIHWPRDFDPEKKYPVVENIYAGPHDHHVPKSFRTRYGHQYGIADMGAIVVQIDGMGTAWRSKAFHDVCWKNLRDGGFPDRIAWMQAAAKKFPQMDLSRVGIYGGSAGGQNAMAALLWHNDFYKVAVADCGCHDNRMDKVWWNEQWMGWPVDDSYKRNSNTENAKLLKGDLMLVVGELDRNVDPASTTQVVDALIKANKDFEFVLVTGTGHGAAESRWGSRKRRNFLAEKLKIGSE